MMKTPVLFPEIVFYRAPNFSDCPGQYTRESADKAGTLNG